MKRINQAVAAMVVTVLSLFTVQAHAALPTGTEGIFTTLATDFGTLMGYGMVLFLLILGAFAGLGLIRRVVSKVAH